MAEEGFDRSEATASEHGRKVAIKVIRPELSAAPERLV